MPELAAKHILYVITKSNWGGAQSYVYTLAREAQARGARVTVAFGGTGRPGSDTGILAERLRDAQIRTLIVPSFARDILPVHEVRAFRELFALLKEERPDILHLNSSKAGGIGALAGRLLRIPRIIFTVHGWAHREPRNLFMRTFIWLSSWATIVLSHVVIAVSEVDRKTAPVFFSRKKIHLIHNGISDFPLRSREEARRFLAPTIPELARCTKWIMVNSELTKNKGVDIAIRAFAGIRTNIDNAALVVVSGGEDREHLSGLIKAYKLERRAFLLGFVPDARQFLLAADVFAMPSRKEGLPLALLEAGHAGLPVVATCVGGIPEIVKHEESGLLVAPNDVDGLADAFTRLLQNPEEAEAFGKALQKRVHTDFSEARMLTETFARY